MGTINPQVPVVGLPNSTEEPKITSAINTIATVINGNLDNANINNAANINASKLLDASVATAKLADNSVTNAKMADNSVNTAELVDNSVSAAKLAALAILSGSIKFAFHSGYGSFDASGVNNCVTIPSVLPGTYLAIGKYGTTTDCHSPDIYIGIGHGSVSQANSINNVSNKMYGGGAAEYVFSHHIAMLEDTSTTTVGMTVNRSAASGVIIGEAQLFGVLAA